MRLRPRHLACVLLAIAGTLVPATAVAAPAPAQQATAPVSTTLKLGASGYAVTVVQMKLASYKFSIEVDGEFGPQTDAVVRIWQDMNGLWVDGEVGPRTLASLGLTTQALSPRVPAANAKTPKAPRAPKAPSEPVEGCYAGLLAAYGLPTDFFVPVIKRESGCDPSAYNGKGNDRSYGLLQINTKDSLWGELQWRCGLTSREQLFDAETNIACAAKLYSAYGKAPWT